MGKIEVTPVNYRQHARNLAAGTASKVKDINPFRLLTDSHYEVLSHYKPELYVLAAFVGDHVFNQIDWPKPEELSFNRSPKRSTYYRNFKAEVLGAVKLHWRNDWGNDDKIGSAVTRGDAVMDWVDPKKTFKEFLATGVGTAIHALGSIMELIPRLHQLERNRPIPLKEAVAATAKSKKIMYQLANKHVDKLWAVESTIFTTISTKVLGLDSFLYETLHSDFFRLENGNELVFNRQTISTLQTADPLMVWTDTPLDEAHRRMQLKTGVQMLGSHGPELGCPALIKLSPETPTLIDKLHKKMIEYAPIVYTSDPLVSA